MVISCEECLVVFLALCTKSTSILTHQRLAIYFEVLLFFVIYYWKWVFVVRLFIHPKDNLFIQTIFPLHLPPSYSIQSHLSKVFTKTVNYVQHLLRHSNAMISRMVSWVVLIHFVISSAIFTVILDYWVWGAKWAITWDVRNVE